MTKTRIERDALGEIEVPAEALWGASTQRAIENFPISARRFTGTFISALASIKAAAAEVNGELGLVGKREAEAIVSAANEVASGKHKDQFPLDVYQTGSGTSINMNANEVIASLANISLGGKLGSWEPVHPNDHVNRCQSSNDVIPSTIHLAAALKIKRRLIPSLDQLRSALETKAGEFGSIVKIGRTHLQDAMPVRMGQVFSGFARQIEKGVERMERVLPPLCELALGGTAVGTGVGAHPEFAEKVCALLSKRLELPLLTAKDRFEALSSRSTLVETGAMLSSIATSLIRIADDIKFMSSGPRLGLGEISIPAVQPGSSIMPGKVNPVIPEMVQQVGMQVMANETAVSMAAAGGHLELNTGLPLIAANLLESIYILSTATAIFTERCISGIVANEERCRENIDRSLALATALAPKIGYARAAGIAKEAASTGRTIREVALEQGIAEAEELEAMLDVWKMTEGG